MIGHVRNNNAIQTWCMLSFLLATLSTVAVVRAQEIQEVQLQIAITDSSDGKPLPGAEIRYSQLELNDPKSVFAGRDGRALIGGLSSSASVRIEVHFQGFARFARVYADPADLSSKVIQVGLSPFSDASVVALLAKPEAYDGLAVRVMGYLVYKVDEKALYLHIEDYRHQLTSNAVALQPLPELIPLLSKLSGEYVLLEGVFRAPSSRDMRPYQGELDEVQRVVATEG